MAAPWLCWQLLRQAARHESGLLAKAGGRHMADDLDGVRGAWLAAVVGLRAYAWRCAGSAVGAAMGTIDALALCCDAAVACVPFGWHIAGLTCSCCCSVKQTCQALTCLRANVMLTAEYARKLCMCMYGAAG